MRYSVVSVAAFAAVASAQTSCFTPNTQELIQNAQVLTTSMINVFAQDNKVTANTTYWDLHGSVVTVFQAIDVTHQGIGACHIQNIPPPAGNYTKADAIRDGERVLTELQTDLQNLSLAVLECNNNSAFTAVCSAMSRFAFFIRPEHPQSSSRRSLRRQTTPTSFPADTQSVILNAESLTNILINSIVQESTATGSEDLDNFYTSLEDVVDRVDVDGKGEDACGNPPVPVWPAGESTEWYIEKVTPILTDIQSSLQDLAQNVIQNDKKSAFVTVCEVFKLKDEMSGLFAPIN